MYIPNGDKQSYQHGRLRLLVLVCTNRSDLKLPKVFKPTSERIFKETLGTSIIYSPMSSPSLNSPSYSESIKSMQLKVSYYLYQHYYNSTKMHLHPCFNFSNKLSFLSYYDCLLFAIRKPFVNI